MQILTRLNKVIAHSAHEYIPVGTSAVCPVTGECYDNALIVTVDCVPTDIDYYEYHYINGRFIKGGTRAELREINHKERIQFWVGTKAEYDALEEVDHNCMYIITDDITGNDVREFMQGIKDGSLKVGVAQTADTVCNETITVLIPIGSNYTRVEGLYLDLGATYSISMMVQNNHGMDSNCSNSYILHIPDTLVQEPDIDNHVHSTTCVIARAGGTYDHHELSYVRWSPGRDEGTDYGGDLFGVQFFKLPDFSQVTRPDETRVLEIRKIASPKTEAAGEEVQV